MDKPMLLCVNCKESSGYWWSDICDACIVKCYQKNFGNWTSGNDDIDKFIQDAQLSAKVCIGTMKRNGYNSSPLCFGTIEWIPYNKFSNIEYIAKGGFGVVYKAIWIDAFMWIWDDVKRSYERKFQHEKVVLKSLNNSKNVTSEFMNKTMLHYKIGGDSVIMLYGITQDPETKNYMMVLEYACNGSLRNLLDIVIKEKQQHDSFRWEQKLKKLRWIAAGLNQIHANGLIHRDLHSGNIVDTCYACITDMGLCKPANYNELENTKKCVYGVLPYVAPEILRGQSYTKAADIYSFGIIMYEVFSELPPYHDIRHDEQLAIRICRGLRPEFKIKVPQLFMHLIKRCLDANPLNRPTAEEIENLTLKWIHNIQTYDKEIKKQINEADEFNYNLVGTGSNEPLSRLSSYETHSEAIYTSRLLDFNNLPEPKNSNDYYEQHDNIISDEFSGSLQIDVSRLNINDEQTDEDKEEMEMMD